MSAEWLIMGGRGAGKTTFLLAFARYLCSGGCRPRRAGRDAHATRAGAVTLIDTPALTEDVEPDPAARRALAEALGRIPKAGVLHVIDASLAGRAPPASGLGAADAALAELGRHHRRYLVLAAKQDLPWARLGLERLAALLPGLPVVAVSAPRHWGFKEVRRFIGVGPG